MVCNTISNDRNLTLISSYRLTVRPFGTTNKDSQTFTEILLTANSPPGGGSVSSDPTTGKYIYICLYV
jgi:hypothetical protein